MTDTTIPPRRAEDILTITKYGDLFPYDKQKMRETFKILAKQWHPDTNSDPQAIKVFEKINELYADAVRSIELGQWEKTNSMIINKQDGKKIILNYDTTFDFELGSCYVTKTKIVYILDGDKKKYYDNAKKRIQNLKYLDKNMEEVLSYLVPKIYQTFETVSGNFVIVIEKSPDVYPLRNVLLYYKGRIYDKHVAWMMSRLCNIACYLKCNHLVHNGINLNNCFISPKDHAIYLYGGWWYAVEENSSMIGTTKDIFSIMPVAIKDSKKASAVTDLESVKMLGRQLLGEENCRKLSLDATVPKAIRNFLISGSGNDSYLEYEKWDQALTDAYGKRKFIEMNIDDIYQRKED